MSDGDFLDELIEARSNDLTEAEGTLYSAVATSGIVYNAEIGWCPVHNELARRYGDGSASCWWASIVESSCDVPGFIPLTVKHATDPEGTK